MKKALLGTGLSGLVGSKFVDMFTDNYEFLNLDLSSGIDITNEDSVREIFSKNPASHVVHFAAFTDVNRAHQENGDKNGLVFKVNVIGTQVIAKVAKEFDKHLIHISTAYVFDGENEGMYTEDDAVNPIEWYGQTKAWAEEEVEKSGANYTIFRIDQPYRQDDFPKKDILHRIKQQLADNTLPPMFTDHTFTATKIEEFAETLDWAVRTSPTGIFHATTDQKMSDYEFALSIKEQFNLPGEVKKGTLAEFLKTAPRPYQKNTALSIEKLRNLRKSADK